ncbi:hypothetical protein RM697_03280 [Ichthyenterobacterium sp. W332]|uniref:DUF4179 domain-containing protein n=1 Tax=Microcosmobacter mediterraneus TaxID=3075607 RepID=A0ABU2YIE0_9FLAO|nr:hypothetical protein [Ichthyenterobacterium sp. W332]MDT0557651.1 hypothetical protein [Ichthyenterobacterium sp. W332]
MKHKNLDTMFERLQSEFDIEVPNSGHENRFLAKLEKTNTSPIPSKPSKLVTLWKPFLAIAASVIICFGIFSIGNQEPEIMDLAAVSPEYSQAQDFFTLTISNELTKLEAERTPETELIINDALTRINGLETEYENLKLDLNESGNDKRVIYAMITNFQNRIELLQHVLEYIDDIKNKKQITNENNTTI